MQDAFLRKVESYKESIRFRQTQTAGGFYSEEDMKKKLARAASDCPRSWAL